MNKFEALDQYMLEPRTVYDWHGEEGTLPLVNCDESDLEVMDEIRNAFLAGANWVLENNQ